MNQQQKIIQTVAEHLGLTPEDLDKEASLRDDLGLGPIELNDLLSNLSDKFEVEFDPTEVEQVKTLQDLIVLVEDNLIG